MGVMQLGTVGSYITLYPDYKYSNVLNLQREDVRTKTGNLYTYIQQGTHRQIKIPESWVSSMNKNLVNSWWQTAANLRFIEDNDYPSSYYTVRILGKEESYQSFVMPYFNIFFEGEIILETI